MAGTIQLVCAYVSNLSWKSCIGIGTVHRRHRPGSDRNGVVVVCVVYTGCSGVVVWRLPVGGYVVTYMCLRCHNDTVVECAFVS